MSKQIPKPGEQVDGTWRQVSDSPFLAADDIPSDGKPVSLTVKNCTAETVTAPTGSQRVMPSLHFEETEKLLALNASNSRALTRLLGSNRPLDWIGKKIQLRRQLVRAWGQDNVPAIRVVER